MRACSRLRRIASWNATSSSRTAWARIKRSARGAKSSAAARGAAGVHAVVAIAARRHDAAPLSHQGRRQDAVAHDVRDAGRKTRAVSDRGGGMKTLGIVGGIAPESTIEYYRQLHAAGVK